MSGKVVTAGLIDARIELPAERSDADVSGAAGGVSSTAERSITNR